MYLTGGFPCQAFSVAGYRKGFRDPRGNLFFEIARLIEELDTPPKAIMLENVKGLSSHDKGKTAEVIKDTLTSTGLFSILEYIEHIKPYKCSSK